MSLIFILLGLVVLLLLWKIMMYPGQSRAGMLEELLIRQYGPRTGRLVAVLLLVLFLLGVLVLAWLRRGWIFSLFRALQ